PFVVPPPVRYDINKPHGRGCRSFCEGWVPGRGLLWSSEALERRLCARRLAAVVDVLPDDVRKAVVRMQAETGRALGRGAGGPVCDHAGDTFVTHELHALAHRLAGDLFQCI